MTTYTLTRQLLDSMLIEERASKVQLGCVMHPRAGVEAHYAALGSLQLTCCECGALAAAVRVGDGPQVQVRSLEEIELTASWAGAVR